MDPKHCAQNYALCEARSTSRPQGLLQAGTPSQNPPALTPQKATGHLDALFAPAAESLAPEVAGWESLAPEVL